jgi:NADH-quinone oxidoreductase subunit J
MQELLFAMGAAGAVAGALTLILSRHPVYSALGMLGTLFSLGMLYVTLLAHFVAGVQIVVYAGAIMTMFLFVIMYVGIDETLDTKESLRFQRIGAWAVIGGSVGVGLLLVTSKLFDWTPGVTSEAPLPSAELLGEAGTVESIGRVLFGTQRIPGNLDSFEPSGWLLPFEVTSILLIVAAVGAVALAMGRPKRRGSDNG